MAYRWLYDVLKKFVGIFFNIFNLLLAGNLPPFGCACVIVEESGQYLVVKNSKGQIGFPSGFMRWHEYPMETALRECEEETGLRVKTRNFIGYSSNVSSHFTRMSTLVMIYDAEVIDGELRSSIEGKPSWMNEAELRRKLYPNQVEFLDLYLSYRGGCDDNTKKFHL